MADADGTAAVETDESPEALADDEIIDYITGRAVKDRANEPVRQRVARALLVEYGIALEDMGRDFTIPVEVEGRRRSNKRADIAVFRPGAAHTLENLTRVVVCRPEPKQSRTVTKIRSFEQARQDLLDLELLLSSEATPHAEYGMWTNGLDFFCLRREATRFGVKFEPRADWPLAPDTLSGTLATRRGLRRGETERLKAAFRRCHNYVHGNEGLPKDAAFWQFLYLLFAKLHDEKVSRRQRTEPRFFVHAQEPFDSAGRQAIQQRVLRLFDEVRREYPLFTSRDEITLSPRALAFIVAELASYDLSGTDIDVKGLAYQELVGTNLRGDRGQYFTPRGVVELAVQILDPQENELVLDPACGTGGFLREVLRHQLERWRIAEGTSGAPDTEEQLVEHEARLARYARERVFGADFDPFLVRAAGMSVMLLTGEQGNAFYMDSLAYPNGDLPGVAPARESLPLGSVDVLLTNPPFGSDIRIEDDWILDQYRGGVAQPWARNRETGALETTAGSRVSAMSPEQLFIQRGVEWLKPGGRMAIVLPNGILSNPGPSDEAIRRWILANCWVLATVELPVEAFVYEANVNILTSVLFLKKKTDQERIAASLGQEQDYAVFMAVAEKVGVDRRGNPVYKRHPDGEVILTARQLTERLRRGGEVIERPITRKEPEIDNDLPVIAEAYRSFRRKHEEPGAKR